MKLQRKWILLLASLAIIVGFYVLREHWVHAFGVFPYLLLLACPLMQLFHGHGHQDHGEKKHGINDGAR